MITFKKHKKEEIPLRVKWFSDPEVSCFLGGSEKYETSLESETQWFENYENSNDKLFYTIFFNHDPIGLVGLSKIQAENAELFIVIGSSEFWGMGIGTKAIIYIEKEAKKMGTKVINLSVHEENNRAIKLFLKSGYKKTNKSNNELFMSKNLD